MLKKGRRITHTFICGGLLSFAFTIAETATMSAPPDFLGADHVVAQLSDQPAEAGEAPKKSPTERLAHDLKQFTAERAAMKPAAAATAWLKLAERYFDLKPASNRRGGLQFLKIVSALPEPAAWPELSKKIAARDLRKGKTYGREMGLLLFAHVLNNDQVKRDEVVGQLDAFFKTNDVKSLGMMAHSAKSLFQTLGKFSDKSGQISAFERELEQAENSGAGYAYVSIPDLVTLAGEKRATEYLQRVFASGANVNIHNAKATTRLARRIALENVDTLKKPVWQLVNSVDAVELYEALDKKFPLKKPKKTSGLDALQGGYDGGNYQRNQARFFYLIGLILENRTADATKLVKQIGAQSAVEQFSSWQLKEIVKSGGARPLYNYFHALLSENPEYPYWDAAIYLASQVGESKEMVTLAEAALKQSGLKTGRVREIRGHLTSAYLAADQVAKAVGQLRLLMAKDAPAESTTEDPAAAMMEVAMQGMGGGSFAGTDPTSSALRLASLGHLLKNDAWLEEGMEKLSTELQKPAGPQQQYGREHHVKSTVALLMKLNRGGEAEALLLTALVAAKEAASEGNANSYSGRRGANEMLASLAHVYFQAGRHQDVVRLLDAVPNWGIADVSALLSARGKHQKNETPTAFIVGRSLYEIGNRVAARQIAREYLYLDPGYDPMYRLLLDIEGKESLPFLEELYARDQFEERPLIWKAHLLRKAGSLDAAEAVVKAAIAVDPSDGEQGKGDRMRVYGVYADIHRDRGDEKQEKFFRGVLRAIRMSENADDLYAAGLYDRGIKMYRESLDHFSDAYCIQSRLAIQLSELGQHEEAEKHYRKAYELMPDSFGRVESHCFGCEQAFNGKRAQGIAERVFTRLAKERPEKAQIHYLLGYLRETQNRYPEALASFREATRRDPDYLNAWGKISGMAHRIQLEPEAGEAAALNLLRLDPLSRHGQPNLGQIRSFSALWKVANTAAQHAHTKADKIYALKASAAKIAETKKSTSQPGSQFFSPSGFSHHGTESVGRDPAELIAKHEVVRAIATFIDSNRSMASGMIW